MLHFKQTVFLLLFLAFCASHNQKDTNQTLFPKPPAEKLDSVGTWLEQDSNYLADQYLPFFEKHFNQQIAVNSIDSAARLLAIAGSAAYGNYSFDSILAQKHLDFLAKYENQIKPRFRSSLYYNLAELFLNHKEFEKSNTYFSKNNFIPTDYYSEFNIACSYDGLSYNFGMIGQHDSAVLYGQKAMILYEKNKDTSGQFSVVHNLAATYRYMFNFSEAEKYSKKGIAIIKEIKDSVGLFSELNALVVIHEEMGSDSIAASTDALVSFEEQWKPTNPQYKLAAQSALAKQFFRDSNYVETGKILKKIAPLYPLVIDDYYTENYVDLLGYYEIATQKPLSLKKVYLDKIQNAKENKYFAHLINYNSILSEEAMSRKDYKTAYAYLQEMNSARDSLQFNKIRYEATELEKKYQTEKKEAQLQLQAADAFKKNVFIGFLVLGLLAFVYFYSLLKKKNTTISQQNELNEQTIAILSHDIKEPLLGVKLLLKKLNKDDPFVAQASNALEGQINSVNGILTNLLKMKRLALIEINKNAVANAQSVVENVVRELTVAIEPKALTIQNELTNDVTLPIAPEKLHIIVHNLLSNAVKYSFPNQTIRIYKEDKGICIQDFGVGLSPEQRTKLMREVTASQRGTNQERGNGLGLFLVGAMLQGEQLTVVFDSPEVGGTIAKVLG